MNGARFNRRAAGTAVLNLALLKAGRARAPKLVSRRRRLLVRASDIDGDTRSQLQEYASELKKDKSYQL